MSDVRDVLGEKWVVDGNNVVVEDCPDGDPRMCCDSPQVAQMGSVLPEALAFIRHVAECLDSNAMIEGHVGVSLLRRAGVLP